MKRAPLILLALAVTLLANCASSTTMRERRISENTAIYEGLSESDRALVEQGEIREGMDKQAVFLAWGRPDDIREGSRSGVPYETWIYTATRAYTQTYLSMGYGYGPGSFYHGYGGRYYRQPHLGFEPGVATSYRPIKVGSVELLNGKVVSWETRKN